MSRKKKSQKKKLDSYIIYLLICIYANDSSEFVHSTLCHLEMVYCQFSLCIYLTKRCEK